MSRCCKRRRALPPPDLSKLHPDIAARSFPIPDWETLTADDFDRLFGKQWRAGIREVARALSSTAQEAQSVP
ncbi:MAG: hypothetical protein SF123_02825 [Chloroflexota bacterium]|nr:hypothetical protein [Chloroflexota bacterium]